MASRVDDAHDRLQQAVGELRAIAVTATGTELCSVLTTVEAGQRMLDQVSVTAIAAAERDGVFAEHGYRSTAGALADLLRWEPRRSRRFVTAAQQVVTRLGLDGQRLAPVLEATAHEFADATISMRHIEVVATLLATAPARRLTPAEWAAVEQELAAQAPDYTSTELHTWGTQLLETLDQDGPEPADERPTPQINEVRISRHRNRSGGTIRGHFDDAEMFDRVAAAIDTHGRPRDADDTRTPAERQAEGLAEICGYALAHAPAAVVPETGGRRPQLVVTVRLEDLENRARAGMLEFGGQTSPSTLRMLACDATVIPVVLGGRGEPLDIGRATRTIPEPLRRAVAARDRGCAHPGCDLPPAWCEVHHIIAWAHHGETRIENLVMLCAVHHRLVHHSGWELRMTAGRPEFVPPGWIDPLRRPRRKPDPIRATRTPVVVGQAGPDDATTVAGIPTPRAAGPPVVGPAVFFDDPADGSAGVEYGPPAVRVMDVSGPG